MYNTSYRVYYEDTDAGGVVYYANYLKFAERARTDWLRSINIEQSRLKAEHGLMFVVRDVTMHLKKPAKLDDMLEVSVQIIKRGKASLTLAQSISRLGVVIAEIEVCVACIDLDFKPRAVPDAIGK